MTLYYLIASKKDLRLAIKRGYKIELLEEVKTLDVNYFRSIDEIVAWVYN